MPEKLLQEEKTKIDLLAIAFHNFNQATQSLEESYQTLKDEIAHLNKKLAETNRELTRKVEELSRIHSYLSNILDSMMEGLIAINPQGKISIFNRAAQEITSQPREKVLGSSYQKVFGDKNRAFTHLLKKTLKDRKPLMAERKFYRENEVVPLEIATNPIKRKDREIEGALAVFRDISAIRKLQEEIQHKQRLAMLGQMAASVAHEIRNPLSAIEGFALLLKDTFREDTKKSQWANNIVKGTRNLNNLVSNLLNFARPLKVNFQQIQIKEIIENSLSFAFQRIGEEKPNIQIKKEIPTQPIKIIADPELLEQAFLNLILNAIQSMANEGKLTISVDKQVYLHPSPHEFFREWEGDYILTKSYGEVHIRFSDTGCGISKEEMKKIFHPFYTTKAKGCGLGLTITQRIIQSHGGGIKVESKEGKGTTFTIYLPLDEIT